jgi:hypothetical protein
MMLKTRPLLLAGLLAATPLAFSGQSPATIASSQPAATAAMAVHVKLDPRKSDATLDKDAIARLGKGQILSVAIDGVGRFDYEIDFVKQTAELLEVGGHIAANSKQKLTLGIRSEGITGLVDTPSMTYALGYGVGGQKVGQLSSKWMTQELAAETSAMQLREAKTDETTPAPAPGAEPASVDLGALTAMRPGEDTVMQLTGLGSVRVRLDALQAGNGSSTWVGHLKDYGEGYSVVLTYSPVATEGYIVTPNGSINLLSNAAGDLYQFNPMAAGYRNGLAEGEPCVKTPGTQPPAAGAHAHSGATSTTVTTRSTSTSSATPPVANATATSGSTVDVLVLYTQGMVDAYGSVAKVATRVDQLVALANQSYANGGLVHRLRLASLEKIAASDTAANGDTLDQLQAGSGPFSGVSARRTAVGADLVAVVRPYYSAQGSCGNGYVLGWGGGSIGSGSAAWGVSAVSDGSDHNGSGWYCDQTTFTHELGHNMGLMHDRATVAEQGGGTGAKPYAFGYDVANRWGTIMSYTSPVQLRFSNPNDYNCGSSERCGLPETDAASADNVKALSLTMPQIAALQGSVAPTTYSVSGVLTVNGTATSGLTLSVGGVSARSGTAVPSSVACQASGSNGVYSCSAPAGYTFTLTPNSPANSRVSWTPASATISAIGANQTANFTGFNEGRYALISRFSGKALDVNGVSKADGANIIQWTYGGGLNQQFDIAGLGDGSFSIRPAHSGKSLDVYQASLDAGAEIRQWSYWGGNNQRWKIVSVGGGYFKVLSVLSGKALDVYDWNANNGALIKQWDDNGYTNQQWQLKRIQ